MRTEERKFCNCYKCGELLAIGDNNHKCDEQVAKKFQDWAKRNPITASHILDDSNKK